MQRSSIKNEYMIEQQRGIYVGSVSELLQLECKCE